MEQAWAAEMKKLLRAIKKSVDDAKTAEMTSLPLKQQKQFQAAYNRLLKNGLELDENQPPPRNGKRGRQKQSKSKNLLDRLTVRKQEALAFMYDFAVPFDNNLAERDLRMMKVQQKSSGCFRTDRGAENFCRIRGYISTIMKQGLHVLTALKTVFVGQPLLPTLGAV